MFYCTNVINEETGETCNTELKPDGCDSRQEWYEEFYYCEKCGRDYTRRVDFKIQSKLIESDVLTDNKTGKIVE